jgi:hypothetical protein
MPAGHTVHADRPACLHLAAGPKYRARGWLGDCDVSRSGWMSKGCWRGWKECCSTELRALSGQFHKYEDVLNLAQNALGL